MNLIQEAFAVSNHLSHRWPQGEPRPIHYHYTSDRRPRRLGKALLVVSLCLVAAAALVFGGYLGMVHLANSLADAQRGSFAPRPSSHVEVNANWDPADLPWAQPDPNVSIFVHDQDTQVLTSNQIYDQVLPSVVCVQADHGGSYNVGSGVILTSDGYILTNAHVIEGAANLIVVLDNNEEYAAQVIGTDTTTDLAVLKIEAENLTAAELGDSGQLQVGEKVVAIGNPAGLNLAGSTTQGCVSGLDRTITVTLDSGETISMEVIQTDAAINPGNSGGALVNKYGQVIGINSSKIAATGYEGLGFAIPIDTAQPIISSLKEYGYVKDRAVLGITGQYIDSMTARFYGYPTAGMYVASVTNPSVSSAGITQGCLITKIDDVTVDSQSAITSYLTQKKAGDTVTLEVYNGLSQQTFTVEVTLAQSTGE